MTYKQIAQAIVAKENEIIRLTRNAVRTQDQNLKNMINARITRIKVQIDELEETY